MVELDDGGQVETVSPRKTPADEGSIAKSLSRPKGFTDLASFVENKKKILVVVNDHTRPTPTLNVLKNLDLKGKDITTLVATGAHRSPSRAELSRILGGLVPPYGGRVLVHNSREKRLLKSLGRTSRGTGLSLSKHLLVADGIITVGSVEPHYFAGFTGGRKFLLPGLAGLESIIMNHSLALDDKSSILSLDGNPVHEDFMEALSLFGKQDSIFSIQTVLNYEHRVSYTSSGDIIQSFMEAVDHAKEIYVCSVEKKADIVVSVAKPPTDLDLYQSQKAIDNVKLALNDGGVVILVSSCRNGIGDRGFYDILASGGGVTEKMKSCFGYHKAAKITNLLKKANVFAITALPSDVLKAISMVPYGDLKSAMEDATRLKGKGARVLIVNDSGITVPLPRQNSL